LTDAGGAAAAAVGRKELGEEKKNGNERAAWQLAICMPLASSVAVSKLCTIGKLCSSWQAVAVGDLYTISELCGS